MPEDLEEQCSESTEGDEEDGWSKVRDDKKKLSIKYKDISK